MIWSKFFSLWPNESSQSARPSLIDVFVRTGVGVGAMGPGGLHFKRRIDSDDKNFQDNWKKVYLYPSTAHHYQQQHLGTGKRQSRDEFQWVPMMFPIHSSIAQRFKILTCPRRPFFLPLEHPLGYSLVPVFVRPLLFPHSLSPRPSRFKSFYNALQSPRLIIIVKSHPHSTHPLLNEGTQPETVNLHQTIFRIRFRFTELPTRAVRDILWNLESRRQRYPTSDEYYLHIERPCSIAMSHSVPFFSFS